MRKIVLVFTPILAAAALFACEDESGNSNGGNFAFDSGPGFDGAQPGQDGAVPDGGADAAPAPVTVVAVKADGTPAQGITVVFHDATGAVLTTSATGADGKLESSGPTPAMASILLGSGRVRHVITWAGVSAGDVLNARDLDATNPFTGSYNVTYTIAGRAVDQYQALVGACAGYTFGNTATPIDLRTTASCVHAGNDNAILMRATYQGADQFYAFKKGNPPPPADGGATDVTVGAWSTVGAMNIAPANVPPNNVTTGRVSQIAGAQVFDGADQNFDVATAFPIAPGFADSIQVVARAAPNPAKDVVMVSRGAPAKTVNVDFAQALPLITDAKIDRSNFTRPKMDWTPAGSLAMTKGGSVLIAWSTSREERRGWTFIVPPGATSVQAPALPAIAADWLPPDPDGGAFGSFVNGPFITFIDTTVVPSPAAFRSNAGLLFNNMLPDRLRGVALPKDGDTLRATEIRPGPPA